jgi:hypothetical protein
LEKKPFTLEPIEDAVVAGAADWLCTVTADPASESTGA